MQFRFVAHFPVARSRHWSSVAALLRQFRVRGERRRSRRHRNSGLEILSPNCSDLRPSRPHTFRKEVYAPPTTIHSGTSEDNTINQYPKTTFHATMTKTYKTRYAKQCLLASGHSSSARTLTTDVTTHRAPSLDGFRHFRFTYTTSS